MCCNLSHKKSAESLLLRQRYLGYLRLGFADTVKKYIFFKDIK